MPKAASVQLDFNPAETALKEAFAVEEQPYPYADPMKDSYDMRDKLAGAADHMTTELTGLEVAFGDTLELLYQQVKEASLEEVELGQMLAAWEQVVPDSAYVKTAFMHIGPRLVEDGVFPSRSAVGASLEKTAHVGLLNKEHPLVGSMADYCMVLDKLAETRAARDELIRERNRMDGFIQKASAVVDVVRKGLQAGGKVTSKATELAGKAMFGNTPGVQRAASAAKYAPHAAAGLAGAAGAKEVSDRVRYSRPVRYGKSLLSPRSMEGQMRMSRLMGGGY